MHRLEVENMCCGGCVKAVNRAVQGVEPNAMVEVDLGAKLVTVSGAERHADRILQAMAKAGFPSGTA